MALEGTMMNEVPKLSHSGRFVLRIAPDLHEALARRAAERSISLNQYVQNLLASHIAGVETAEYCYHMAQRSTLARMEKQAERYLSQIEQQVLARTETDSTFPEERP